MFADRVGAKVAMRSFGDLVAALEATGSCKGHPIAVERALKECTPSLRWMRPLFRFAKGRYTRTLLHRTEKFELLLLCWDKGARTPVHGHAAQTCWFTPLLGAFDFDNYEQIAGGPGPGFAQLRKAGSLRNVGAGLFDRRDEDHDLHQVRIAEGYERAVSLHLYAGPIDECLAYDLEQHRATLVRMRYEFVRGVRARPMPGFEAPAATAPGAFARLLRQPARAWRAVMHRPPPGRLAAP